MAWVGKYGITPAELIRNHVVYSPSKQQLIFQFYENNKCASGQAPILWQARNFWDQSRQRYFTVGEKEECLPIYDQVATRHDVHAVQGSTTRLTNEICAERDGTLFIVEDCISAIKTSRQHDSMPCLGSTLSKAKLSHLMASYPHYKRFIVWLDSNMYDKAQQISQRLRLLGAKSHTVWTKDDPKCYNDEQIVNVLDTCG